MRLWQVEWQQTKKSEKDWKRLGSWAISVVSALSTHNRPLDWILRSQRTGSFCPFRSGGPGKISYQTG